MPHNQSAKKRLRQNLERRTRNKARLTELKTIRKQLARAIHDGQKDKVEGIYRKLAKRVDQASSANTVHPNTAARIKSRVSAQVHAFINAPAKA
jgi:small subunit ribosomal protein S20